MYPLHLIHRRICVLCVFLGPFQAKHLRKGRLANSPYHLALPRRFLPRTIEEKVRQNIVDAKYSNHTSTPQSIDQAALSCAEDSTQALSSAPRTGPFDQQA